MEIIILLILWSISIPICVKYARKIDGNVVVAGLAGFVAPILVPIGYAYVAARCKQARFGRKLASLPPFLLLGIGCWSYFDKYMHKRLLLCSKEATMGSLLGGG